jgi:diaminohydroxyphosphoribosylaminopyrimidine deaminase/5-amino-6-(5-phosphoribosylamino)uracil reductase
MTERMGPHVVARGDSAARRAIGVSEPNPRVGCVLLDAHGATMAEGSTQRAGMAHAEVQALSAARAAGLDPRGATAYVTLEPCSHHGRTPPCCDALVAAGVTKVVVAIRDPNPLVAGRGLERLRTAGVAVELLPADHPAALASRELNIGFFSRMIRRRPWVRLKVAASLDGRTALDNGASQWITGPEARADGHAWRRRAGAVLTGIGTVLDDDPRLDVRLVPTEVQPLRVVVDSRLEIPLDARILQPPGTVLVYTAADLRGDAAAKAAALAERGVTLQHCPGAGGKVDLAAMLDDLARREVNELHVEAGHKLNGSFVREGLVDELLCYLAPTMLGLGREMARFGPLESLQDGLAMEFVDVERVGADLRVRARPPGRADF